jgi:hypothetical protein
MRIEKMIDEDRKNPLQQDQNVEKSAEYENTPQNVIYNSARFNKQFLDSLIITKKVIPLIEKHKHKFVV